MPLRLDDNQQIAPHIGLSVNEEATLMCSANMRTVRTGFLGLIGSDLVKQDMVNIVLVPIEINKPH